MSEDANSGKKPGIIARLRDAEARERALAEANEQLEEAAAEIVRLGAELSGAQAEVEKFKVEVAGLEQKISELQAALEAKEDELKDAKEETEKAEESASSKAAELVEEKLGVPVENLPAADDAEAPQGPQTKEEAWALVQALDAVTQAEERAAEYRKHRAILES